MSEPEDRDRAWNALVLITDDLVALRFDLRVRRLEFPIARSRVLALAERLRDVGEALRIEVKS